MGTFEEYSIGFRHRRISVESTFMIRQAGLILVAALLLAMPAVAQTVAAPAVPPQVGNTTGTVIDISGAVIPAAEVVVTSTDGRTTTIRTDGDGTFNAGTIASRIRV